MPSALNMLTKHERASYCNRYWENQFRKVITLILFELLYFFCSFLEHTGELRIFILRRKNCYISSVLPQLAWDKRLCCCCCISSVLQTCCICDSLTDHHLYFLMGISFDHELILSSIFKKSENVSFSK
jgi:hypothetical protein